MQEQAHNESGRAQSEAGKYRGSSIGKLSCCLFNYDFGFYFQPLSAIRSKYFFGTNEGEMGHKTHKAEKISQTAGEVPFKEALRALQSAKSGKPLTDEQILEKIEQHHARIVKRIQTGELPAEYAVSYTVVERGPGSILNMRTYFPSRSTKATKSKLPSVRATPS